MQQQAKKTTQFRGSGLELFLIQVKNAICIMFTLGIYMPWAKVSKLRFYINNIAYGADRLNFLATPAQLLKSYGMAGLIFMLVYFLPFVIFFLLNQLLGQMVGAIVAAVFFPYFGILFFESISLGSRRFRYGHTSLKGIRFAVDMNRKDYVKALAPKLASVFMTLGFALPAYIQTRTELVINNMRWGSLRMTYSGTQSDIRALVFKAVILSIFTAGLYGIFYVELNRYIVNHSKIGDVPLSLNATGSSFVKLCITNVIILIFTLGLGFSWVLVRNHRYFVNAFSTPNLSLEAMSKNALGKSSARPVTDASEGLGDLMDVDGGVF